MLALFGLAAVAFLGKPVSAAIISGDSMEPTLHGGDLVILRSAPTYRVGDVAAYNHPDLGLLIHRVIEEGEDRLTLQGDNRREADAYHPSPAEVDGALLIHIPNAGSAIEWFRQPEVLAVLAGLGGVFAVYPLLRQPSRRERLRRGVTATAPRSTLQSPAIAVGLVVLSAGAALVALYYWAEPDHEVPFENTYQHVGSLAYSAPGAPGIYDTPSAQSGDPIFRALSDSLSLEFNYRVDSLLPVTATGRYQMYAQLRQGNGWTRRVDLISSTPFEGASASARATLDLGGLWRVVDRVASETEVNSRTHELMIVAEVDSTGTLVGKTFEDRFATTARFSMEEKQVVLLSGPAGGDPLASSLGGSVTTFSTQPSSLGALGLEIAVVDARKLMAVVLALAVAALGVIAALAILSLRQDETDSIRSRYRSLLVPAKLRHVAAQSSLAEVGEFKHLVDLARAEGVPILDEQLDVGHRFVVIRLDGAYYYRPGAGDLASTRPADAAA
jgi:signal peptidase